MVKEKKDAKRSPSKTLKKAKVPPAGRKRILLKVGGRVFETWEENLRKHPSTLLGSKEKELYYNPETKMYTFERDPLMFRHILNYYRAGRLHYSCDYCADEFREELSFFGISINAVDNCCWDDYRQTRKINIDKVFKLEDPLENAENGIPVKITLKERVWLIFDNPEKSFFGLLWYYVSGLMIALSIACTVAETIPPPCDESVICGAQYTLVCKGMLQNRTLIEEPRRTPASNPACQELSDYIKSKTQAFFVLESICVGVFTFEYLSRLLTAPKRWDFVKGYMSIIDVVSILPYYAGIIMENVFQTSVDSLGSLVLLRVLRVFRVLKFTRHSSRLRSLLFAIQRSASELGFIVFSLSLGVVLISSMLYYVEKDGTGGDMFNSIPATMWYSVVTMTTTGYGDLVPHTALGKIIGSVGCIIGVLMIALPVPIIQKKANLQMGLLDEVDQAFQKE
ncbi:potassium voltage-gated channel subfamily D member 2 [Nematostella vectensis]|uniref:potassium voltage-gated channel subfamily D member 2 n=1 Tax=Nematostella vectensis TaxID=45351 RepID=UPI001390638D|nr:potassium voltage-gated channel subfamily D member 2 [Nematostella vectensis]XP_048585376.1 potassium voltage-gated channel subfamily D member 2 [Nematostella vectensis]XP_048585377.1 potassium voltage-gated channel subfamily D member 2 [Nematostella vectensis]XP_048585378.1 potassium voltage-gated channel subfamily D member 2 [Nematostella vectensis]